MNKKNENIRIIINGIITSLITSILVFIINSSIYLFNKEKVNISISDSIYENNQYITSISIKNYQKNISIKEMLIWFSNVNITRIESNLKNINNNTENKIVFSDIMPSYTGTIILYSDSKIDKDNIKIETGVKEQIVFLKDQEESAYINIKKYVIIALIYFVVLSFTNIIVSLKTNEKINEKIEEQKQEKDKLEKELKAIEKTIDENKEQQIEIRTKLIKELADYSKELRFWKDTIRKILYKSKDKKIESEDMFNIVTKGLGTYNTLNKIYYEDVEDIIKNSNNKNKE